MKQKSFLLKLFIATILSINQKLKTQIKPVPLGIRTSAFSGIAYSFIINF